MIFKRKAAVPPQVEMAIAAARQLGFDGEIAYDAGGEQLQIEGLGTVRLGPAMQDVAGRTEAQQRARMSAMIERAVRANPVELPARYDALAPELRDVLQRKLTDLRIRPDTPAKLEAIGRIERAGGLDGWTETLARAAFGFAALAETDPSDGWHLGAANMFRMIGDTAAATSHAEAAIPLVSTAWSSATLNPGAGTLCAAYVLAGRRSELPELAARFGQPQLGPRWWPICTAAGAAEAGDSVALAREVEAAERSGEEEPYEWEGTEPSDRDLAEILRGWLSELG